jgi:membrane-associated phospholipid phosphatase
MFSHIPRLQMLVQQRAARQVALAALLAAAACLGLAIDLPIARYFREHPVRGELRTFFRLAEVFAQGGGVLMVIGAVVSLDRRSYRLLPRLIASAYGTGLVADLLKLLYGRMRPETIGSFASIDSVSDTFCGLAVWLQAPSWTAALSRDLQSMPSGHAATAAGLACALCRLYPRATPYFIAMAVLACCQRVLFEAHFVSDVLAGASIGVLASSLLEIPSVRARLAGWEKIVGSPC